MTKTLALASLTLGSLISLASVAHADDASPATTATATNLVVVTPNAPVVVTTAGASAPGAAAPAAEAAPHNEDWSHVSHINGQVVPVGERGAYLTTFKANNVSANPFGILFGYVDVSYAHAVSPNVALAASFTYLSAGDSTSTGATLSAPIYFRRTFSGPYLEPGLQINSVNSPDYSTYYSSNSSGPLTNTTDRFASAEVLVGWQWSFDSGLNLAMAAGAARRISGSNGMSYSDGEVAPAGYFRVGYEF